MDLIDIQLEKRFVEIGMQLSDNPVIIAEFYHPALPRRRFLTEYNSKAKVAYGFIQKQDSAKRTYFALPQISGIIWPDWTKVERNFGFTEVFFDDLGIIN